MTFRPTVARIEFVAESVSVDSTGGGGLEAAARTLRSLLERGTDLYHVRAEPGADLRDAVAHGLGRIGRAFGAARTVELARSGRYDEAVHGGWLDEFPPSLWSGRERALAPALVVEVDGAGTRHGEPGYSR